MRGPMDLAAEIDRIDGRGYKAYRDLEGAWPFSNFELFIDRVQSDPFASPSKLRIRVPARALALPETTLSTRTRRVASAAFLARRLRASIQDFAPRRSGTGKSGLVEIDAGGQEVLERTAVVFLDETGHQLLGDVGDDDRFEFIEARIEVGLPASGRRILGRAAAALLLEVIPRVVERGWIEPDETVQSDLVRFVHCIENQESVRSQLAARGLIAFVGDGALLPRESGASERPMSSESTLPFLSPQAFRVEFEVPHADGPASDGSWRGMGVPRGVVLLVGGGYHGKSTLLRAIEKCVVPHVPGDGRETVVSDAALVKIRAEDGRAVTGVELHGFIDHLPSVPGVRNPPDTRAFSTTDASGSTSQAANIIEALEVGASGLLLDEDTSATNFMLRDARMQALVHPRDEPITPFRERVRALYDAFGVSSLIVMGSSGEYFRVADAVIELRDYRAHDVTARAHELALPETDAVDSGRADLEWPGDRFPDPASFDPLRGRRSVKLSSRGCDEIVFGTTEIDLRGLDQLFDSSQTRAIANSIQIAASRWMGPNRSMRSLLDELEALLDSQGLDVLDPRAERSAGNGAPSGRHPGAFARPRRFEVAGTINRMRSLRVRSKD